MIFVFFFGLFSVITTELLQKDLYVRGDGTVTREDLRSKGNFKTIENVIFEDGPTVINSGFQEMSSLKTIKFSSSIKLFLNGQFYRASSLAKFIVPPDNPHIWTDGTFLYQNNNQTLVGSISKPTHFNVLDTVTELQSCCFASVRFSSEITLPKSIAIITGNPFVESEFSSIKFEKGSKLEILPKNSVNWCTITKFAIPPSIKQIHQQAFYQCNSKQMYFEDVENSELTSISSEAFSYCKCTSITLPAGVREIPDNCFLSSTLVSIEISANCSNISETAFSGCSELSSVRVDANSRYYKDIKGSLYSADGKQLVFAPLQLESFEILPELESISQSVVQGLVRVDRIIINESEYFSAFEGCLHDRTGSVLRGVCGGVKYLNISAKTTRIMSRACKGVGIVSVKFLGEKCQTIGDEVFNGCKSLKEFCVPRGLESIGGECFANSGLTSFTYESVSSLSTISGSVFVSLNLKIIKLPKSLKIVGFNSFRSVKNVETFELELGSCMETINSLAFSSIKCAKKNSIILPQTLKYMYNEAFAGSDLEVSFAAGCNISTLETEVFKNCKEIRGTFVIPSKVETIKTSALSGCENIEAIEFEGKSELRTVMGSAFAGCASLMTLELPELTESFDNSAIGGCYSLREFRVSKGNGNFVADENILYNSNKTEVVVCSPGVVDGFVDKRVESIRSNGFYMCSKLSSVSFNSPSNLKMISQNTFAGCTSLASVALPTKLREILDGGFSGCERLESVVFGVSGVSELSRIGPSAFNGCSILSRVEFNGEGLEEIGESAFEGCRALRRIEVPKSLRRIGRFCFRSSGVEVMKLGSIDGFGEGAFSGCVELREVEIVSAKEISKSLFEGCLCLQSFVIPSNAEVLGPKCFKGTGLKNIKIPPSVERMESECFENNIYLSEINISGDSIETFSTDSFAGCGEVSRIVYCSTRVFNGDYGFDSSKCIAYVNVNYTANEFCGLAARRQLKEGCAFVDPTATPSSLFTGPGGGMPCNLGMIAATVIEALDECEG